jgi:cytochrome c nitrite reductase small subunit
MKVFCRLVIEECAHVSGHREDPDPQLAALLVWCAGIRAVCSCGDGSGNGGLHRPLRRRIVLSQQRSQGVRQLPCDARRVRRLAEVKSSCNDCHVPHAFIPKYLVKAENGLWHSKGFTLQDYHEPIRLRDVSLKILNHNCRDCHHDLISGMHGDHEFEYETASCVHCHGSVGHGPQR